MANEHNKDGLNLGWQLQLYILHFTGFSPLLYMQLCMAEINIDVVLREEFRLQYSLLYQSSGQSSEYIIHTVQLRLRPWCNIHVLAIAYL